MLRSVRAVGSSTRSFAAKIHMTSLHHQHQPIKLGTLPMQSGSWMVHARALSGRSGRGSRYSQPGRKPVRVAEYEEQQQYQEVSRTQQQGVRYEEEEKDQAAYQQK